MMKKMKGILSEGEIDVEVRLGENVLVKEEKERKEIERKMENRVREILKREIMGREIKED